MPAHSLHCSMKTSASSALLAVFMVLSTTTGLAQTIEENPFQHGLVLDPASSSLTFQTITNGSDLETSRFTSIQGSVDENGLATVSIQLDSVETDSDLRNVRVRFLLFETHKFAEAVVSATINPSWLSTLSEEGRLSIPLAFDLALHGVTQKLQMQVNVTQLAGNQVSVASAAPLSLKTALFGLSDGVKNLEESANVSIVPMGAVSFSFIFNPRESSAPEADAPQAIMPDSIASADTDAGPKTDAIAADNAVAPAEAASEATPSVILNSNGNKPAVAAAEAPAPEQVLPNYTDKECAERFKLLSEKGEIDFQIAGARIDAKSIPTLKSIIDVIKRCPKMSVEVGGHTDSVGSDEANQNLSELRAKSVMEYLITNNVDARRLTSKGYGEAQPLVPNINAYNRKRNRRIEFTIIK